MLYSIAPVPRRSTRFSQHGRSFLVLQLDVSQASTICRASGRAMRSLGIWLRQSAFCKLKKNFSFPWTGKENYAAYYSSIC